MMPLMIMGGVMLGAGYWLSAQATAYWQFVLIQAVMIGMLGASVGFGPLVADISLWFRKRRGIAVALVASGNYLAGAVWPPIIEPLIEQVGWRQTHMMIGIVCVVTILPLSLALRRRAAVSDDGLIEPGAKFAVRRQRTLAGGATDAPGGGGPRLLHRHVDAAGAYRRLLPGSRLRHGARR